VSRRVDRRLRQFHEYQRQVGETEARQFRPRPTLAEFQLSDIVVAQVKAADAKRFSWDRFWNGLGCAGQAIAAPVLFVVTAAGWFTIPIILLVQWLYRTAFPDPLQKPRDAYARYTDALKSYDRWQAQVVEENRRRLARSREEFWERLDGTQFEHEIASLLRALGHSVRRVGGAGDEGIDLWVDDTTMVQCKAYAVAVAPALVREVLGARLHSKAQKAIMVAPKGFTKAAVAFAAKHDIELWDARHLVELQRRAGTLRE
jgi:hypothetical protein